MKNGICPKCKGSNIYTSLDSTPHYGDRAIIEVSVFHALRTVIYICSDCRYIEEFVKDDQSLDKVMSKWKKVAK